MEKKTTVSFTDDELYRIIEVFGWGVSDYPDTETDEYKEIIKLGQKFEKARCRLNDEKWSKEESYFE